MLGMHEQRLAVLIDGAGVTPAGNLEVDARRLGVAVGEACEADNALGGLVLSSLVWRGNPDVVASACGRSGSQIFGNVEVAAAIKREVIRHFEVRRGVQANLHVVIDEGRIVLA